MRNVLTMRKLAALSAVLSVSALGLAAVPASASLGNAPAAHRSAITPDTAFTDVQLCDTDDGLCMSGHDGDGGNITTKPFATGIAETVNISQSPECDGTVEYLPHANPPVYCPFTDYALDNKYSTDDLVVIKNADNGMVYRTNDQEINVFESSSVDFEVWVQDGNFLASSGPPADLINVGATNGLGHSVAACSNGPGAVITLQVPGGLLGDCAWRVHS